jgi:catechol 2,3-dioxygenase-like lactoylglutathione lyase family enzyme
MRSERYHLFILITCILIAGFPSADVSAQADKRRAPVLGGGAGIEFVVIVVRDIEAAKDTYRDALGLKFPPKGDVDVNPAGIKDCTASLEKGGYLELTAINDLAKAKQNRPARLEFLNRRGEGAESIIFDISSAEETVGFLRSRGFEVADPRPDPVRRVVAFGGPYPEHLAARLVFFEFADRLARQERMRQAVVEGKLRQANTAVGIEAVWVVVNDLDAAVRAYGSIGMSAGKKREFRHLGANGQEIETGRGRIVLLKPKGIRGRAASFLAKKGEGIMGLSIEVSSLWTARTLLEKNTNRKFSTYAGAYGDSILIPAEIAHGVWIEMFQKSKAR